MEKVSIDIMILGGEILRHPHIPLEQEETSDREMDT